MMKWKEIKIFELFSIKNGEEPTNIYRKWDAALLACVLENFIKAILNESDISPLLCVCLPGFTWLCGLS